MGASASVTKTIGEPPPFNPSFQRQHLEGSNDLFAPSFPSFVPKTLYKVECPVYIHANSMALTKSANNPDLCAVSFSMNCTQPCTMKIYVYAKEEVEEEENTKTIKSLATASNSSAKEPREISIEPKSEYIFDGWHYDTGILNRNDIKSHKVDLNHTWSVIISMTVNTISPTIAQRLLSYCAVRIVDGDMRIKMITQKCLIQNRGYFVHEMYGLDEMSSDNDKGKECVVCMTNNRDTCVLPCRHVCCCADCANTLRLQSDKCPVCRKPMTELVYLSVNPSFLSGVRDESGVMNVEMESM